MPEDLQHYPFFPFRSGIYFEKTCQLAEVCHVAERSC